MPKISPCLWFDNQAEEAANFYCSIFRNSKINDIARFSEAGPGPKGNVMVVSFELDGQPYTALNGGPIFRFTEAVSLQIHCTTQREVDDYWEKLLAGGGSEGQCGWLKDKYGLSWQVVPVPVLELFAHGEPARVKAMTEVMFKMKKLDIAAMTAAYNA